MTDQPTAGVALKPCPFCGGPATQSIETAPKNERVLAEVVYDPPHRYFGAGRVEAGGIGDDGWFGEGAGGKPVQWMPMPKTGEVP